ncbi:dihydroxyacetone kinase subunit DhaK [Psychrilyobacter sp.]|uniref:dihydroxyacetone kinase subunit DhaK n=1 Tax=Psychrilyobacter sp. TaxID=2586924 RepID=UPI00301A676D
MNKIFFNEKETIVDDAINGLLATNKYNNLTKLNLGENIRVISRKNIDKNKVSIISGGGSGHEPAHAGFVGKGMLTAAVCGDIFASPSIDAVLNAILSVSGKVGCLLIVKNYTGDRLNFGLAAERAKKMGIPVEVVIVKEDIAIENADQPRGLAGTLFIHKVAGYYAEQGASLEKVKKMAEECNKRIATIGVAITNCRIPGVNYTDRIKEGEAELGLGIHGEPGINLLKYIQAQELSRELMGKLEEHNSKDEKYAILINNLGGISPLEMNLITNDIFKEKFFNSCDYFIGPSAYMTSMDMKGFSISSIQLTEDILIALQSEVEVESWTGITPKRLIKAEPLQTFTTNIEYTATTNKNVKEIVEVICHAIINSETELNRLDSLVGDGDTGSTFKSGASEILNHSRKNNFPLDDLGVLFQVIGEKLAVVMGGSSGVLLSIFFTASGVEYDATKDLYKSLLKGLEQMKFFGGANIGDCTMIDALEPALLTLEKYGINKAIEEAKIGADSTSKMLKARAGRSSYVNEENLNGIKDPGALAIENIFASLRK